MPTAAAEPCELALELATMRELLRDYCPCEKRPKPPAWRRLLSHLAQHGQTPTPSCCYVCPWCNHRIKSGRHGAHTEHHCPKRPFQ